jgi:hypothetical protein
LTEISEHRGASNRTIRSLKEELLIFLRLTQFDCRDSVRSQIRGLLDNQRLPYLSRANLAGNSIGNRRIELFSRKECARRKIDDQIEISNRQPEAQKALVLIWGKALI